MICSRSLSNFVCVVLLQLLLIIHSLVAADYTGSNNGINYRVVTTGYSWSQAKSNCASLGAGWGLAELYDSSAQTYVKSLYGISSSNFLWIGGEKVGAGWRWTTSRRLISAVGFAGWGTGEPSGSSGCMMFWYQWAGIPSWSNSDTFPCSRSDAWSICSNPNKPPRTRTRSRGRAATMTLSDSADRTRFSISGTDDRSRSVSPTPDNGASTTMTASPSPSLSPDRSLSASFGTADRSATKDSKSASLSPTADAKTPSLSPTRDETRTQSNTTLRRKMPTRSHSASLSDANATRTRATDENASATDSATADRTFSAASPSRDLTRATYSQSDNASTVSRSRFTADATATRSEPSISDSADTRTPERTRTGKTLTMQLHQGVPPEPALKTLTTVASFVSLVSGAGFIATQQSRMQAALSLSQCGTGAGLDDTMDVISSPLQIQFGATTSSTLRWQRGAAFGNLYCIAIFALIIMALAYFLHKFGGSRKYPISFSQALTRLRFPSILVVPLAVLSAPTAEATATLWLHGQLFNDATLAVFSSVSMVFAPLLLVSIISLPNYCQARLLKLPPPPPSLHQSTKKQQRRRSGMLNISESVAELEDPLLIEMSTNSSSTASSSSSSSASVVKKSSSGAASSSSLQPQTTTAATTTTTKTCSEKLRSAWHWLVLPLDADGDHVEWFDKDLPAPKHGPQHKSLRGIEVHRGPWVSRFGVPFEDMAIPLFAVLDIAVSTVLGWTAGAAAGRLSRASCLMWLATASTASLAHFAFMIFKRPMLPRLQQWFYALCSMTTFVVVLLALLTFVSSSFVDFQSASSTLFSIQSSFAVVTAILELVSVGVFFAELYDSWSGNRATAGDDDDSSSDDDGDEEERKKKQKKKQQNENTRTFDLQQLIDQLELHNTGSGADDEIDLSILLSSSAENNKNNAKADEDIEIDLSEFIGETGATSDEQDTTAAEVLIVPEEPPVPQVQQQQPRYSLADDEDAADGDGGYKLDDDDGGGLDSDDALAHQKSIGSAHRANMEQFEHLRKLLDKK